VLSGEATHNIFIVLTDQGSNPRPTAL